MLFQLFIEIFLLIDKCLTYLSISSNCLLCITVYKAVLLIYKYFPQSKRKIRGNVLWKCSNPFLKIWDHFFSPCHKQKGTWWPLIGLQSVDYIWYLPPHRQWLESSAKDKPRTSTKLCNYEVLLLAVALNVKQREEKKSHIIIDIFQFCSSNLENLIWEDTDLPLP